MKQMKKGKDTKLTDVFGNIIHVGDTLVGYIKQSGVCKELHSFEVSAHTKVRLQVTKKTFGNVKPPRWVWGNVYPKNCIVVEKYDA